MDDMCEEAFVEVSWIFPSLYTATKILTYIPGLSPLIWVLENLYQAGGIALTPCAFQFYIFSLHNFLNRIKEH